MELKPSYIVPADYDKTSLQVHLHHTDRSKSNVAISWATPTKSNCSPTVVVGSKTYTGVTRTYKTAILEDKSAASFHHVDLDQLTDGSTVAYTIKCNTTVFSASFVAPNQKAEKSDSYSFAVFGDMGITQAAHDTVASMSAVASQLNAVYHVGDLSYARGNDNVWNQFFAMIEPIASKMPWYDILTIKLAH